MNPPRVSQQRQRGPVGPSRVCFIRRLGQYKDCLAAPSQRGLPGSVARLEHHVATLASPDLQRDEARRFYAALIEHEGDAEGRARVSEFVVPNLLERLGCSPRLRAADLPEAPDPVPAGRSPVEGTAG